MNRIEPQERQIICGTTSNTFIFCIWGGGGVRENMMFAQFFIYHTLPIILKFKKSKELASEKIKGRIK
jgi:hypothetical protein